jgi:hypothetical protein
MVARVVSIGIGSPEGHMGEIQWQEGEWLFEPKEGLVWAVSDLQYILETIKHAQAYFGTAQKRKCSTGQPGEGER